MADQTPPSLGYGQRGEAPINTVNVWMRSQPWYQDLLRSFGQDPNNVHLNDSQKQSVIQAAQAHGVVVDEGHNGQTVDDSGNFQAKSHALRNTLIVAGIAAASIATMGAAGVFGGGALAAGEGAGAATGAGASAAGASAGLGAIEGGAYGLSDAALAGLGTGAMGSTAAGAGLGAIEGGGWGLGDSALSSLGSGASDAAGSGAWDAAGNFIGDSTVNGGADAASGGSILSKLLGAGKGLLSSNAGEAIGKGLADSANAAAKNRGTTAKLILDQNSDLEKQLLARDQNSRLATSSSYRNAMLGDRAATWQPIQAPTGIRMPAYQGPTANSQAAGSTLYNEAMNRLKAPDIANNTGLPAYRNLSTDPAFQATLQPSGLENTAGTASWLLPTITSALKGWS